MKFLAQYLCGRGTADALQYAIGPKVSEQPLKQPDMILPLVILSSSTAKRTIVFISRSAMSLVLICLLWMVSPFAFADESDRTALEFFESKIRPVLVQECYGCHSQEADKKGKLRGSLFLDSRDGAKKGGDTGPAVVPSEVDKSLIISAIRHQDFEMPPKGKLSDAIIADFEKWIASGAVDPRDSKVVSPARVIDWDQGRTHWAFQPLLEQAPIPNVIDTSLSNPIDQFIRREQVAKGLNQNAIADKRTLIRRAWIDLLGLPPSPDEMATWMTRLTPNGDSRYVGVDRSAWWQLIDHLLDSPRHGERWARHWMDVARFAESHGYEQDYDRPNAFHYRDFLIRAFNTDMPYDQFVRWQLAGDELAPEDPLAWMATGFLGAGAFPTQLTETEFESARYDELDDMVATTGVTFLGLSVGCARCHDHKFDPITSKEYYSLASAFASVIRCEKSFDLAQEANRAIRDSHEESLADLRRQLNELDKSMPRRLVDWIKTVRDESEWRNEWSTLAGKLESTGKTQFVPQSDGSFLATDKPPAKDKVTFIVEVKDTLQFAGIRVEALCDESLPNRGPGRADNGNFVLSNIEVFVETPEKPEAVLIPLVKAIATHQQNEASLSVQSSIDSDPISGWAVDGQIGRDQAAAFFSDQTRSIEKGSKLRCVLSFQHSNPKHAIGKLRLSLTSNSDAHVQVGQAGPSPELVKRLGQLREIVMKLPSGESQSVTALIQKIGESIEDWKDTIVWFSKKQSDWRELHEKIEKNEKAGPPVKMTTIQIASEGLRPMKHHADDRGYPHFYPQVHVLRRGDVHQKGDVASPGPLVVLTSKSKPIDWAAKDLDRNAPGPSFRRSQFADWITDPDHGSGALAARVMVNRLWQHHFGRGIVGTPNDFGSSGDKPTHPELLEWLAKELIDGEWKLKRMHRLIMTSNTYMQSSAGTRPEAEPANANPQLIDPENRTWWRRYPRRLEAEALRDSLLSTSGLLDSSMYGPGTLDENMRRRSVYFFIKRSQLIPSMMLFDWPEHLVSIGERSSTTIAPQALMFMNGKLGRQAAEGIATKIVSQTPVVDIDVRSAITKAYQIGYQRDATPIEHRVGEQFLGQLVIARSTTPSNAGAQTVPMKASDVPLDCWSDYCQALLSANEFIYVD